MIDHITISKIVQTYNLEFKNKVFYKKVGKTAEKCPYL